MPAAIGGFVLVRDEAYWREREKIDDACGFDKQKNHELTSALHERMYRDVVYGKKVNECPQQ